MLRPQSAIGPLLVFAAVNMTWATPSPAEFAVEGFVFAAAGSVGQESESTMEIHGTLGEPFASIVGRGQWQVQSGFWGVVLDAPVPVRILQFTASWASGGAWIAWTLTNDALSQVNLYRSETAEGPRTKLSNQPITESGNGAYLDQTAPRVLRLFYWLQETTRTGDVLWHGPAILTEVPLPFQVLQNVPNPFSSATSIAFSLPAPGQVAIRVFDVQGREMALLVDEVLPAGMHEIPWGGRDRRGNLLPAGTYFYSVITPFGTEKRKLVVSR